MSISLFLLFVTGLFLSAILGANNASACFGANVGAGFVRYRTAAILAALGVFLGVIIEGAKLSRAVYHGVLGEVSMEAMTIIMVTAMIIIGVATIFRLPLSLSESLIGSAVGIGIGSQINVNWRFTLTVFAFWVINPFFSAILSVAICRMLSYATSRVKNILTLNYIYGKVASALSFYVAYVLGANTLGLVSGIYAPFMPIKEIIPLLFGLAAALGIYFLSRGITESVGREIIGLSPVTALVSQLSGAITVHLFTQFGLPVSITQAQVGGILGIGVAKRIVFMNKRKTRNIIFGWMLAPLVGAIISWLLSYTI
ncbi:anion permease [Candidatus Bathyarchaeota archaeon]|nr:anion permease [Candidatus Bathyarchaeota archaeon]